MSKQDFLQLACAVVAQHYQDPDFSVEAFASSMGISRVHLSRRLTDVCGLNASAFIRETRLCIAAEMLAQNTKRNITEVAYDVGFGSHAYFSKCFYERFNLTPREYSKGA